MKIERLIFILFLIPFLSIKAQVEEDVRLWASEIIENMASESENDEDFSYILDELVRLSYSPILINEANREELEAIPFLNDRQIEELLFTRYQLGSYNSIYDLQMVKGFDRQTIEWLSPLITFEKAEVVRKWKHRPKGDMLIRGQQILETQAGYKMRDDGSIPYAGNPTKIFGRLQFTPLRNVDIGIVTEKDPGEAIFTNDTKGMDYIDGYISWSPNKFIKQIIVGQYRMRAGQGLVLQTSMPARKSSMSTSIRNRNPSYRPSLSIVESGGLKGGMIAMGNRNFTFTPFVSYQKRDATLAEDEDGNTIVTSLKTDGFHRTETEIRNRKTTEELIYGAQIKYYLGRFILDVGHLEYQLEYPLIPKWQPYNNFFFNGNHSRNSWLALDGTFKNINMFGELATDYNSRPAVWAGMLYGIEGHTDLSVSYRNIPKDYVAPLGAPFTESGTFAGEKGLYIGMINSLPGGITLSSYIDYFKYEWLKFQTKAPSDGFDFLTELKHSPSYGWENVIRYRHKEKSVNLTSLNRNNSPITLQTKDQLRFQTRYSANGWRFTTRVDFSFVKEEGRDAPTGILLSQDVRYKTNDGKWTFTARYAKMDTRDFETRIYAYEPDVLYGFSIPAYYGQGTRWVAMAHYKINKSMQLWLRYALWHYTDRDEIGSSHSLIDGNKSNEVKIQMRWKF